jgi:hypothetical protein
VWCCLASERAGGLYSRGAKEYPFVTVIKLEFITELGVRKINMLIHMELHPDPVRKKHTQFS